jgi:hypothetical protein
MSQYAERAMAYMIRLAALYALSERRDEVSEADFDAALALVSYSIETIAYVLPEAETSEEASMTIKVEAFIREAGHVGRTATEIYRAFNIKASDLHGIVAELDTITVVKGESAKGRGGRPSVRYIYTGESVEDFDGDDITEADIVGETADVVGDETSDGEETSALLAPLLVVADEETNPETAEEISSPDTVSSATVCPVILSDDEWEAFDAVSVEAAPAPAKSAPVMVNPNLPRGVDALRAFLDGTAVPEPAKAPERVKPAPAPQGVDALRALLEAAPATETTTAPTQVPAAPVPLVLFQAPAGEDVAA